MDCPFTKASLINARDMVPSSGAGSDAVAGWVVIIGSVEAAVVVAGAQPARVRNNKQETAINLMTVLLVSLLRIA
jgi:hypothetical protein